MTKRKAMAMMVENEWKRYGSKGTLINHIDLYKKKGIICQLVTGIMRAKSISFYDDHGALLGYHNLITGDQWYSEEVIELCM